MTITLSGLRGRPTASRGTLDWRLQVCYTDCTFHLGPLLNEIRQSFDVAGFQVAGYRETGPDHYVVLLSTMHALIRPREAIRDPRQPGKLREPGPPLFETKDIIQKFENFVFAEDIRLERLSLCELGLQRKIRRFGTEARLQEVCSVPLP